MQKQLESTILESDIPVLIFVKHTKCNEQINLELEIEKKINSSSHVVNLIALCYPHGKIPFPSPQWNLVYFFEPKNINPILSIDGDYFINDFDQVFDSFHAIVNNIPLDTYLAQKNNPKKVEEVRKMVEKEDISKYPSTFQMARNLFTQAWKSTKEAISTGQLLVEASTAQHRYSICEACSLFELKDKRCTACGCFMESKVHLQAAECPEGKWQ